MLSIIIRCIPTSDFFGCKKWALKLMKYCICMHINAFRKLFLKNTWETTKSGYPGEEELGSWGLWTCKKQTFYFTTFHTGCILKSSSYATLL